MIPACANRDDADSGALGRRDGLYMRDKGDSKGSGFLPRPRLDLGNAQEAQTETHVSSRNEAARRVLCVCHGTSVRPACILGP